MKLKNRPCTGMMAQWVKAAIAKSENTKSIIRIYTVKGENFRKLTPDLDTHTRTHIQTHGHMDIHIHT